MKKNDMIITLARFFIFRKNPAAYTIDPIIRRGQVFPPNSCAPGFLGSLNIPAAYQPNP